MYRVLELVSCLTTNKILYVNAEDGVVNFYSLMAKKDSAQLFKIKNRQWHLKISTGGKPANPHNFENWTYFPPQYDITAQKNH